MVLENERRNKEKIEHKNQKKNENYRRGVMRAEKGLNINKQDQTEKEQNTNHKQIQEMTR